MAAPEKQQNKTASKRSPCSSTKSDKQAPTHTGRSSTAHTSRLCDRRSQAPWLQLYCSKTRRVCTMLLRLLCSPGWLMSSTHTVCTQTSHNHIADETFNTGTQEGSKRSRLQKHCSSSSRDSSNQIIWLVYVQQVISSDMVSG